MMVSFLLSIIYISTSVYVHAMKRVLTRSLKGTIQGIQRTEVDGMMFKYCKKCVAMRQFRQIHGYDSVRQCDVCGLDG